MATYKMRSALGGICPWNPLWLPSVPPPASVHRGQDIVPLSISIVTATACQPGPRAARRVLGVSLTS